MRNSKKRCLLLRFFVSLALFSASSVFAEDVFQKRTTEWGIHTGFGENFYSNKGSGPNVREDIQFFFVSPWWAKVLKKWESGGSLDFIAEGFLSYIRQESSDRYGVGITPLFAYSFKDSGKVIPFFELGVGILYTDLDPERFGSAFNFTPQTGLGIRYQIAPGRYLRFSYRYHHISNAGLDSENRGIDSNFFSIGLSFIR